MNITASGMLGRSRTDHVSRQLNNAARSGSYDPTSPAIRSNHETDKQAEDNATWLFEYKALLNSKITTLITSLTSAYTSDMDASMGDNKAAVPWINAKNNMQGITGIKDANNQTVIDPGSARTAFAYLLTYKTIASTTPTITYSGSTASSWYGTSAAAAGSADSVKIEYATGNNIQGTTTFISGGNPEFELDRLNINLNNLNANTYTSIKAEMGALEPSFTGKRIGNNLELTLYKFLARPENLDVIRFDLFKNIFVVGTSSLPTGSQVQGSLSLNWIAGQGTVPGYCSIKQERYAAFFHS